MRRRSAWVLLFAGLASCAGESALPTRADFAEIMAEARGERPIGGRGDSDVRRAVRGSFRTVLYMDSVHAAEISHRWRRPALSTSYFLRDESMVGGDFPAGTAKLIRESQKANREYLTGMRGYPDLLRDLLGSTSLPPDRVETLVGELADTLLASRAGPIEYFEALDPFFDSTADMYELAARYPDEFVAARDGLEIGSVSVQNEFNALVLRVNASAEAANAALQRLSDDEKGRVLGMGLATVAAPIRP